MPPLTGNAQRMPLEAPQFHAKAAVFENKGEENMIAISNPIDIDSQQVLYSIGYADGCEPPPRVESLVNDYVENVHDLIAPSFSFVIRDVEMVLGSSVVIEGSIIFQSHIIARLLEQCEKVAVFTLTIGNLLEEMANLLAEDGLVIQAMVLDAIGSVATEKVADFVQERIGRVANAVGFHISRRFSPGYCDWEVNQQKMVFQAMDGDTAGVKLTEGCMMLPQKSISGIIGISSSDVEKYNPCKTCNKRDCVGRR